MEGKPQAPNRVLLLLVKGKRQKFTSKERDNETGLDYFGARWTDGNLYVWESGSSRGGVGPYTAGDVFRAAVESGVVKYRKNGTLLYTSAVAPNYPLLIDSTIYPQGGSIANAVIGGNFGNPNANINWLVADQLGTPRMVFDKTGSLAGTKRHDYLPFGEDIFAGTGSRNTAQGYLTLPNPNDGVRQKFTSKERDIETGLDYFGARYYSNVQGRFTSADPLMASAERSDPQTWNRYTYVTNNPLGFTDPTGERRNPVTGRRGINPVPANGTLGGVRSNRGNPHVGEWGMTRNGGARPHFGTDITAPVGTNLVAMESGTVTFADNTAGDGGRQVHVRMADGTVYKYFHLSAIPEGIARDVAVQEGQVIAVSGNSGNAGGLAATNEDHVHVSVIGANGNINPVTWLNDPNAGVPVDVVSTTGTPPATPITVAAGTANEQTITGPNGTVTVRQQPLPAGQPHEHPAPARQQPRPQPQ
jgi:RHS repeat-associated protein